MKEIEKKLDGEILLTPCPYGKKHGVGLDKVMIGSDQCWGCKCFKGLHGSNDIHKVYCNYEDTHQTKK
jgi:hypothetical protein